jgi:hypothetical protein
MFEDMGLWEFDFLCLWISELFYDFVVFFLDFVDDHFLNFEEKKNWIFYQYHEWRCDEGEEGEDGRDGKK